MANTYDVSKQGLAKIARRRGLAFIISELWQNCVDTNAKNVEITLTKLPGRPAAEIIVTDDDPEGFKDLSHSYTLFATSEKIHDPEKRGRFNFGEKLVIAVCDSAEISSTTGTIIFDEDGRRRSHRKREKGSQFKGTIRMNQAEYQECCDAIWRLIPPEGVRTTYNGQEIPHRRPLRALEATLPTVVADAEGILRPTKRKTVVRVYEVKPGEVASLYEMGIPVVETGDTYHVEIGQKVPLNSDRDNVTPAYLEAVRVLVLNEMYSVLTKEQSTEAWVRDAASNHNCKDEAITKILDLRFGEKRVAYDPSDQEANNLALSKGYAVVAGGALSAGEWANSKRAKATPPAGEVCPSRPRKLVDAEYLQEKELTPGMMRLRQLVMDASIPVLGILVGVLFTKNRGLSTAATWSDGTLTFHVGSLGQKWFDQIEAKNIDLIIHEFAHHFAGTHYDDRYYKALSKVGARFTMFAVEQPEFFTW